MATRQLSLGLGSDNTRSLRWRLVVCTALLVGLVVLIVGAMTRQLIHQAVTDQWHADLQDRLESLLAYQGLMGLEQVQPGLYGERYSGHYWQVFPAYPSDPLAQRSASLADFDLETGPATLAGHSHYIRGPLDEDLLVLFSQQRLDDGVQRGLAVARDAAPLQRLLRQIDRSTIVALAVLWLAATVVAAGTTAVVSRPIHALAQDLAALRRSERTEVSEDLPSELRPLATELNRVMRLNAARIRRQRESAANLAHELKTPLTALQQRAELDQTVDAAFIRERIQRMWAPLEQELARARIHGPTPGLVPTSTLRELERAISLCCSDHGASVADFDNRVPPGHQLPLEARDLFTVVWNLLDNGLKHGRPPLRISTTATGLCIENAGTSTETTTPDSQGGAGLRLVGHILDAYGWELCVTGSDLGGRACRIQPTAGNEKTAA